MSKRKADPKIEYYKEKIRKIEEKNRQRRRIIVSSSDSSDNENQPETENNTPVEIIAAGPADVEPSQNSGSNNPEIPQGGTGVSQDTIPELDSDILVALGTKTGDESEYGDKIHESLAQLWLPLLKKGLPKEGKDKILKGYLIPENCALLQAPKLNPEISAAITENARSRDKKILSQQQQLSSGITAINRAMDLLVGSGDDKLKTIKYLSDACRILSDLHHVNTLSRVKLITPSLDKNFLNLIQDICRDETLFGNKLAEKIKASKAIEKQGLQIKKFVSNALPSTSAARSFQQRGNWSGPPRYCSSKASRGGGKKAPSSRKSHTATAAPAKPAYRPHTRAQTTPQQ